MEKEKTPLTVPNNGISLIFKGTENRGGFLNTFFSVVLNLLMVLCLSLGAMYTLITMFSLPHNSILFPLVSVIFAIAVVVIYSLPKKPMLICLGASLAAIGVYIVVLGSDFSDGLVFLRDAVIYGISKSMRWPVAAFTYSVSDIVASEMTVVLLFIAFILILFVGFFTVRKILFIPVAILTFLFFELGAAFGCIPNHYAFAVLLSGWTGLFAMSAAVRVKKFRARRKDKKKTKAKAVDYKKSFISSVGVLIASVTFVTFLFCNYLVALAGYDRPENMKQLRADVKEVVMDIIEYILGMDEDGTLNEGQLYLLKERVIKDEHQLTVVAPLRSTVYLKGFVGEDYTGTRWQDLDDEGEYENLLEKFQKADYTPQEMQGLLLSEMQFGNEIVKNSVATITVKDIEKRKDYAYLAYIPQIPEGFSFVGDSYARPDNVSEYSYNAFLDDRNFFLMNIAELFNDTNFSAAMTEYNKFVKKQYTALPEGMEDVRKIVADLIDGKKYGYEMGAGSNLDIAERIRKYLADNTEYDLTVSALPEGKDFVRNFLFESKRGYAPHYATAMAVMLRMAGVPTRYVEGFVANHEDYNSGIQGDDGYYELELTDKNSHAWIEVYEPNYGWINIDATPGFYSDSIQSVIDSAFENIPPEIQEEITLPDEFAQPENGGEALDGEQGVVGDGYILDAEAEEEADPTPEVETKDELLKPEPTFLEKVLNVLKYIGIFMLSLILALAVAVSAIMLILSSRRRYKLKRLDMALSSKNRERKVLAIYRYYSKILKFENLENTEQLPYMKYAQKICARSEFLRKDQHLKAMSLFLKHRFADEALRENELECLVRVIGEYQNNAMAGLKGKRLFKFKYIDNLG